MNETRRLLLAALAGAPLACWCSSAISQEAQEATDAPSRLEDLDPTLDRTQVPDETADDVLSEEEIALRDESKRVRESAIARPRSLSDFLSHFDLEPESLTEEFIRDQPEVRDAFQQMLIARFDREKQILSERRNVIGWTNWISRFIFLVVHVVLAVGLWAAMREFNDAGRTRKRSPPPITTALTGAPAQAAREQNELSVSLEGIALKTSLHGLLILAAAIGFYFLYLKFVYPITVIGD